MLGEKVLLEMPDRKRRKKVLQKISSKKGLAGIGWQKTLCEKVLRETSGRKLIGKRRTNIKQKVLLKTQNEFLTAPVFAV